MIDVGGIIGVLYTTDPALQGNPGAATARHIRGRGERP